MFAFAPALIAVGFGVWAASPANAPISPQIGQGIEPSQIMVNAKELRIVEFFDYTFVSPQPPAIAAMTSRKAALRSASQSCRHFLPMKRILSHPPRPGRP